MGEQQNTAGPATRIEYNGPPLVGPENTLPPPPDIDGTLTQRYREGSLLFAAQGIQIENVILDAAGQADYALYLFKVVSVATTVRGVTVQNANKVGLFIDASGMTVDQVGASCNVQDGIVMVNNNASSVNNSSASHNGRNGFVVTHRTGHESSSGAGGVNLLHGVAQQNGHAPLAGRCRIPFTGSSARGDGNGVYVIGTLATTIVQGIRLEGNRWDGLRAENAHDVHFLYNQTSAAAAGEFDADGDSLNRGIALHNCDHCTVRGNQIAAGPNNCEDILVVDSDYAYVSENIYNSGLRPTHNIGGPSRFLEVNLVDSGVKSTVTQHHIQSAYAYAPPTSGSWTQGDIVWNRKPALGQPAGWMCERAGVDERGRGRCASWLAMGVLTRP